MSSVIAINRICKFIILFNYCATTFIRPVEGNRPPQFVLSEGQSEIVLRLKEGKETPVGSLIYKLKGYDYDDDPLTFGLRGQVANELLRIENLGTDEANVYLKKELDRELEEEYMLVLTLTDGRLAEGSFVTQSLLILVEDINDNSPQCSTENSTVKVPENSEVPRVLTTIECTDLDEGPYGQVIYKLQTEPGDEEVFSVSTQNGKGVLKLLQPLDYDRKFLYQLRVLAVDRANTGQINTATNAILVEVEDVSDQAPEWLVVPSVTRIREDVPKGTFVLQVRAVDGDRGVNNPITYSLLNENELFGVDSQSGVVYTKATLDREDDKGGSYILQLVATEQAKTKNSLSVTTEVTILLLDVNDETPTFSSRSYVAEVVENSPIDVPVTFLGDSVAECYDHDLGVNGTFRLYTQGDGGVFDVTPSQVINQASFLIRVKNPARLDYESIKAINFSLIAEEISGGKTSKVPVTVFLRDANDNNLEFEKEIYKVNINENSVPGTTVVKIKATDKDSGLFGTEGIRYTSITGPISDELNLDPLTGIITVKAGRNGKSALDREINPVHFLTVEARDNAGRGNRNTVQIQLELNDVNDEKPKFIMSRYEGRIFENEIEFISPLICEAKDNDLAGSPNSAIHYTIVAGNDDNYLSIDKLTGRINVTKPIDFEKLPIIPQHPQSNVKKINFTVRANDLGTPPLFSLVPVTVWVLDQNDFAPQFKILTYNKIIREDTAPGTQIVKVEAYDGDSSTPFNNVFYRIEKGAQDKFIVDSETGSVRLSPGASLDYNTQQSHVLEIFAIDGGGIKSEKPTTVNITVLDTNNKPPYFIFNTEDGNHSNQIELSTGVYHARIVENSPKGTYITQIRALDPDHKPILRYKIDFNKSEARNEHGRLVRVDLGSMFDLQPIDGVLKVGTGIIDREIIESVKIFLEVEDKGSENGRQVATATMMIQIIDEQDNEPVFRKPYYYASIPENSKDGTLLLTVTADDADTDKNIRYSIVPRTNDVDRVEFPFNIDAESGAITVGHSSKIDRELREWINFTVMAEDAGTVTKKRVGRAEVAVKILDINDNTPQFFPGNDSITVREDVRIGTVIGIVKAKDLDEGMNGKITYVLDKKSAMGKFAIDPESGMIRTAGPLDREEVPIYALVVQAWDNYYGYQTADSRNSFKQIEVILEDVNDCKPKFIDGDEKFTVTEFHEGTIGTIRAKDDDFVDSPNSWVTFKIKSGNNLGLFKLEQGKNTAKLNPARSLKGFYGNYTLLIEASDSGKPQNSVTKEFNVAVTDFNDNSPKFLTAQNLTVRVPENATIGTTLVQVRAIDSDTGINGIVRYRLRKDLSGHWEMFEINPTTGVVSLVKELDREKQKLYHIRIEAFDLGQIPLSSELDLTIRVENIDDFQPVFSVESISLNFTENQLPGKERFILPETIDKDDEDDEEQKEKKPVCYFIIPDQQNSTILFGVEPFEHFIYTKVKLDRETKSLYTLTVAATQDCSREGKNLGRPVGKPSSFLRVQINVNDVNDNRPIFEKSVFTGGITTSSDYGIEILQVTAKDADAPNTLNSKLSYFIIPPITMSLSEGLNHLLNQNELFTIDKKTGTILLNFDPQPDMKGFFTINVGVNDTFGLTDKAKVLIYLLREDQKVKVVVRRNPIDVRQHVEKFVRTLSNITGAIVNTDRSSFKFHENSDGSIDKTKTDFYIHFVHPEKNIVLEVEQVLKLIDLNIEDLDELFKEFNVIDTQGGTITAMSTSKGNGGPDKKNLFLVYASSSALFLAVVLFVVISLCFAQRAKYQRQLKAATTNAYGSNSTIIPRTGNVPNTNVHSVEGSNPIWMQAYHNTWYKEDSISENSETRDSLDENAIGTESSPPSSHMRSFIGSDRDRSRRNDLSSGTSTFHKNLIYNNRMDTNSTCLILKKHLETTEL